MDLVPIRTRSDSTLIRSAKVLKLIYYAERELHDTKLYHLRVYDISIKPYKLTKFGYDNNLDRHITYLCIT